MAPATLSLQNNKLVNSFKVSAPNVQYTSDHIISDYVYRDAKVSYDPSGEMTVTPTEKSYQFKVNRKVPKLG
jgi:myo-inositol-1-phosphate synthase